MLQQAGEAEAESNSANTGVLAASSAKSATTARSFRGISLGLMGYRRLKILSLCACMQLPEEK